jgi:DNA polymerase-3 subunit delta'
MAFSEIFGHLGPLAVLRRALVTGRVSHAYLFAGPEGIGKATVALNFAKALMCHNQGHDACEACEACRKVNHGNHPDVVGLDTEGAQIRIELIRDIQRHMVHRPLEGRWRVILIDRAHDLTPQAASALLKVLEEPPEGNVMILIARSRASLLPTIVSRCQVVNFVPLTISQLAEYLQEREGWDAQRAHRVSVQAQGNVKTALDLGDEPVLVEKLNLVDFVTNLRDLSLSQVLEHAQVWGQGRHDARLALACLQGVFRDMVLLRLGSETSDHQDSQKRLFDEAPKWRIQDLISGWDWISEALVGIERNYNVNLVMDHLFLRLFRMRKDNPESIKAPRAPLGDHL